MIALFVYLSHTPTIRNIAFSVFQKYSSIVTEAVRGFTISPAYSFLPFQDLSPQLRDRLYLGASSPPCSKSRKAWGSLIYRKLDDPHYLKGCLQVAWIEVFDVVLLIQTHSESPLPRGLNLFDFA